MGLLPTVLTFCEGIFEINLRPKLFSGGSDSSCLERERWKTMTVVVEWQ